MNRMKRMIVALVALASVPLWAGEIPKEIVVSSGGYDYRLVFQSVEGSNKAEVIGETEGYKGVRLPTVANFIDYRGPRGFCGRYYTQVSDGGGELVIEGFHDNDVVGKDEYRYKHEFRRVTISGIRSIEGADLISDLGYVGLGRGRNRHRCICVRQFERAGGAA